MSIEHSLSLLLGFFEMRFSSLLKFEFYSRYVGYIICVAFITVECNLDKCNFIRYRIQCGFYVIFTRNVLYSEVTYQLGFRLVP